MIIFSSFFYLEVIQGNGSSDYHDHGEIRVSVQKGNYLVKITEMRQLDVSEMKFQLLDSRGGIKVNADNETIYDEVDVITAVPYSINQSFFENESDTNPLNGTDDQSHYYYVVFLDRDQNEQVNVGDQFLIKGNGNGGVASKGDLFRLRSDRTKKTIWEAEFPKA